MFKNGTEFCGEFPFDDYRVIILKVKDDEDWFYEAWIRHKDYGLMNCMFGLEENKFMDLEKFKLVVLKNIVDAIDVYDADYVNVN